MKGSCEWAGPGQMLRGHLRPELLGLVDAALVHRLVLLKTLQIRLWYFAIQWRQVRCGLQRNMLLLFSHINYFQDYRAFVPSNRSAGLP